MGSGIKEPDPCPGWIKTGREMLDANRADRGSGGGDGSIRRGQPHALFSQTVGDSGQIDSEYGGSDPEPFLFSSLSADSSSSG